MTNMDIVYTIVKQNDTYFLQPFTDMFKIPKKIYGGLDKLMYRFWSTFVVRPGSLGIILTGPPGSGKALKWDTKVRIPNGWKMISLLKVGDLVMSKDGTYTKVNGVYPQGKRDMYRITFKDGRYVDCDIEHLWEIYDKNRNTQIQKDTPIVVTTDEVIKRFNYKNTKGIYIDLPEADTGDSKENLLIDPYLLGVLIGDGCLRDTVRFSSNDEYVINKVRDIVSKNNLTVNYISKYDYAIVDYTQRDNSLRIALEYYGLFKKYSHEKFIPKEYMESSIENRLALLNGLMDTDGTVGEETPSYSTSSLRLAKDIQLLIRSLGGTAYMGTKETYYTKGPGTERVKCRLSYRISIRYKKPKELFTLPRQLDKLKEKNQYSDNLKLRIESIVKLEGKHEAVCIAVDHPSKLYVVKDYIVTHNTNLAEMIGNLGLINRFKVVLVTDIIADIELVKFIDNLDRTIVIFDEFGKNFNHSLQDKMLTMFNDLSGKRKMFIMTDNDEGSISSFIRNRPGRALYHISFKRIKKNVIEEYCKDKYIDLSSEFYATLNKIHDKALVFSFDHLKALVDEHVAYPEETFEELLEVLNLDILTKEENLKIVSINDISDPNDIKAVELENTDVRVEKKVFESGRSFWVYPKNGGGSIGIKPEDVILIEDDRLICEIANKYRVILEVC